mmetsp:Transcript_20389/g.66132  ORF Transcript_20389/g.66132 Transcript_20389/m.66132 type:complete len:340 (-) Transcript_20389:47-1066(-)
MGRRRAPHRHGLRLDLHDAGGDGGRPATGHRRVPRVQVRAQARCAMLGRWRHLQRGQDLKGAGVRRVGRHDGLAAGRHGRGARRLLLQGRRPAQDVPRHGLHRRHEQGHVGRPLLLLRLGRPGGPGRVGRRDGQGVAQAVPAVPLDQPPALAAGHGPQVAPGALGRTLLRRPQVRAAHLRVADGGWSPRLAPLQAQGVQLSRRRHATAAWRRRAAEFGGASFLAMRAAAGEHGRRRLTDSTESRSPLPTTPPPRKKMVRRGIEERTGHRNGQGAPSGCAVSIQCDAISTQLCISPGSHSGPRPRAPSTNEKEARGYRRTHPPRTTTSARRRRIGQLGDV